MHYPENAPIACSLNDTRDRERAWAAVMETALRARMATAEGVRLEFAPAPEAAHALLDLVAAERECCAWASWTLTSTPAATVVEVAAAGAGPEVLQSIFGLRD